MSPQQILKEAADLSQEDLIELQCGIAELMASRFSPEEIAEINRALDEADAEFARGESLSGAEMRRSICLPSPNGAI
jgi:hypothetical protein